MTVPPVSIAMSSSIALRRSPKPGALTAATFRPPRSLLTTSVAKRLALDVLGDDEQRLARLHHGFQNGKHRLQTGKLLLVDEDVGALQLGNHLVGVGDEVGGEIAAVELHALDDVELGLEALGLLDRDDALVADPLHRLGDLGADLDVAVGGDGADLGDLVVRLDLLGLAFQLVDDGGDGEIDAALQVHRVGAGRNRLGAFLDDGLRQHGRRRGAVAGDVGGLGGDLAHHLGAHVLELVLELDLLGDRHAVLGHARGAERLLEHDVATLGAQRHLDRVGEYVDAAQHLLARVLAKFDVLGRHVKQLLWMGRIIAGGTIRIRLRRGRRLFLRSLRRCRSPS